MDVSNNDNLRKMKMTSLLGWMALKQRHKTSNPISTLSDITGFYQFIFAGKHSPPVGLVSNNVIRLPSIGQFCQ